MTRRAIADLRRGDYVWIARTWPWPVVYHDRAELADDHEITVGDRTSRLTGWAFTRCGIRVHKAIWEPGWSERRGRFAPGPSRGDDLPLRLLNPHETRPCRKCFDNTENG